MRILHCLVRWHDKRHFYRQFVLDYIKNMSIFSVVGSYHVDVELCLTWKILAVNLGPRNKEEKWGHLGCMLKIIWKYK